MYRTRSQTQTGAMGNDENAHPHGAKPGATRRQPFSDLANTFLGRNGARDAGKSGLDDGKTRLRSVRGLGGHSQVASESLSRSMSNTLGTRSGAHHALPDIDRADARNPQCVPEYVNDIYAYWRKVEPLYRPSPHYMTHQDSNGKKLQQDINEKMRAILIDWLVEVHLKFKLLPETLFLTVNLIDRFLAKKPVTRKNLQLVGVSAMLIASKYEEIWAPEVKDFVYISDKAYTRDQILAMEKYMLNALKFKMTVPTPYHFLQRWKKAGGVVDRTTEQLAHFLVEITLPDYTALQYTGSLVATAAVYTALRIRGKDCWPVALAKHSGYREEEVRACAKYLCELHRKAPKASLMAVHKKYSSSKFLEVAKLPAADL